MKNKAESRYSLSRKEFGFVVMSVLVFFTLFSIAIGLIYLRNASVSNAYMFLVLVLLVMVSFAVYIYFTEPDVLKIKRKVLALLSTMLLSFLLIISVSRLLNIYAAPLCLCALLVVLLVGNKISFFSNFSVIIIFYMAESFFGSANSTELFFLMFSGVISSVIASYSLSRHTRRFHYIIIASYTGLSSFATLGALYFLTLWGSEFVLTSFLMMFISALLSGIVNIMAFFIITPIFEKLFNIVSDFRYAELSSTNQPLLKQLLEEAPGTFHHSMAVSNYVEACAAAIGEDTYFARCAALYHDIGKLKNPQYFIENLQSGKNPHDDLTPELSVMFIKKHVMNGVTIATEHKLPNEIKAVIAEHHGTLPIFAFFEKAKKYSETLPDIKIYSYEGDCPTTKVAAIVMIADASEAALRALAPENKASAAVIVDRIILDRLTSRQFDDCDITQKELKIIKETIVTSFVGVKHERIIYPGQEKKKEA